jgi:hypothetical protein
MEDEPRVAGLAALAICESMLLSLTERGVIDEVEAKAILKDAAATHHNAALVTEHGSEHEAAARLIEEIIRRSVGPRPL